MNIIHYAQFHEHPATGVMRRRSDVLLTLRERIVSGVHFGRIVNGDRLPSARRLSAELKADVRVVAGAYDRLVAEGLVTRRPNSRSYYANVERAPAGALVPSSEWLIDTMADALARGVRVPELVAQVQRSVETVRIRATCFECNDDQMRWLSTELERDYGFITATVDLRSLGDDHEPTPEMAHSNVFVTTATHAAEVRPLAQRLGKPLILVTLRMEVLSELAPLLANGPVYYLCTDPRFAEKLRRLYLGVPMGENARPVLLDVDDLSEIPDDAPVWVTQSALDRLGNIPSRFRSVSSGQNFSPETVHDLISYLVRTNLAAATAMDGTRPAGKG
jgi:DNA-binding transcriptional regulator YhcF (GntR family)